jgi:mannose-1-phosphate guanylyltransferase
MANPAKVETTTMATGNGTGNRRPLPIGSERSAIVLAGGDGTRLRELTRQIAGDDRPKQFCPLVGEETLIDETRRRVARSVSPSQTFFSVTTTHARFYVPLLADVRSRQIVAQPGNRGTAPAILYALLRVAAVAPYDAVAILPSDHYVSDDAQFMAHVDAAFDLVMARPDLVTLLGITPDHPETEYGWIEPAPAIGGPRGRPLHGVRRFWEKPDAALARTLFEGGCLWNSFVMVGHTATLVDLIEQTLPDLTRAFRPIRRFMGTPLEATVAAAVYQELPAADFSKSVLGGSAARLAVFPVRGVAWSDLGRPERVRAVAGGAATARSTTPRHALVAAAG